jgi:phosphate-selective porin OprO and OprP
MHVTAAQAQQAPVDENTLRIQQLEEEVRALKALLPQQPSTNPIVPASPQAPPPADPQQIQQIISDYLQSMQDKQAAKTVAAPKTDTFVVGEDNKLNVTWDNGGFRFQSANRDFTLHMGGRMMADQVWFTNSPQLNATSSQAGTPLANYTGVGPGLGAGILPGALTDGFFLRRARFVADGTVFQTIDFKVEFDFENYNNIAFDESFIGFRELPWIGMVRIGQMHVPFGLEAYASSRWLSTMERSPVFEAFYNEFAPGIFTNTTWLDQRVTMQHMFHRIDNFNQFNGAAFGDGRYAYSGRVSALPLWEYDGRCLLHLGLAYQFRKGSIPGDFNGGTPVPDPNPAVTTNTDLVRFRSRQSLRDAVGQQGNGARVVDTGNIIANDVQSLNAEWLSYWGPFSIQAEACWAHVDDAFYPAAANATKRGDLDFWGTYVQFGYLLTGEARGYDKAMGKHGRVVPFENAFLVRGEDGSLKHGLGAWELVYRYSALNLNDDNVLGGIYTEHTIGLNWYWTPSIKWQINYINGYRSVPAPAFSGTVQGLGVRAALEF